MHEPLPQFAIIAHLVREMRYALSEETYVFPRAVGYSSCAVAFSGGSSNRRMSFNPLHGGGGHFSFLFLFHVIKQASKVMSFRDQLNLHLLPINYWS